MVNVNTEKLTSERACEDDVVDEKGCEPKELLLV